MTSTSTAEAATPSLSFSDNLSRSDTRLGELIATFDWSASLGPVDQWPKSLQTLTLFLLRSPFPIVLLWGADGIMLYNDAYSVFASGRHPYLLGSKVREGWPEVADFNDNVMKVGLAGGTLQYQDQELTLYRSGEAEQVWMNLDYSPVMDDHGQVAGVICLLTETSEKVRASAEADGAKGRAASKSAEQVAILNQLAEGVIVADAEGCIIFVNEAAERLHGVKMLGVPPEDYSTQYHLLTTEGEYYPPHELPLARAVLNEETLVDERWRILRPDGREVLAIGTAKPIYDHEGQRLGAVLTVRDDTERAAAEDRLREAADRYRLVTRATNDAIWDWDLIHNHVQWNDAIYSVFGYREDEVDQTGTWWIDHIDADDRARVGDSIHAVIDGHEEHWSEEYCFLNAAGDRVHVLDRGYVLRDEDGKAVRMIGAMLDLSERKRAEQALRHLNETLEHRIAEAVAEREAVEQALRQAQKMEAVGQLTGGIAHDFNNMLAVVIGSLDLLTRRIGNADDLRLKRYVTAALEGANRAALLTQRLLAFSRQQPLKPEPIDVNRLVGGMSDLLRHSLGGHVQLETVLSGGLWRTHADPNQLENVILNLGVNARDAMPGGGKLTIETQNAHLDDHYAAKEVGVVPGQYVLLAVTDTGSGMPPEVIAKAFDPFFTTKEVGKGTGLGLSQVYGFVKQSGGHIRIYSEQGVGTTIKVYLPRLTVSHLEVAASTESGDYPIGDLQEVVLVVEDEPVVRQFSVDALTDLGYRVLEADGALAALKLLDDRPDISLLFTDVVMPEINGAKLAEEARRRRPDLRVLFTTGYTRNAIVHNGTLDPGVELLGKPFTIDQLANKVRNVLDKPLNA